MNVHTRWIKYFFFVKEAQLDKLSCLLSEHKDNLIALMTNRSYDNDEFSSNLRT